MAHDQDNPGIRVPPPLIYLLALLLGLLLNRRLPILFFSRAQVAWPFSATILGITDQGHDSVGRLRSFCSD